MEAIVAEKLVKRFETKIRKGLFRSEKKVVEALRGVSFTIRRGEIFGLLGPNGAGKTTTIKILSTLLLPDSGDAYVNGYHVVREARKVREQLGVMLYIEKGLYRRLTGRENLEYYAALQHIPPSDAKRRVERLLELVEMTEHADKLVDEYSLGMKARISFARALITDAPILFLDEPTLGLDPASARKIRDVIRELSRREGKTILLTTHNMWEADALADRIAIIDQGRILTIGSPMELKAAVSKGDVLQIEVMGAYNGVIKKIGSIGGVRYVKLDSEEPAAQRAVVRVGLDGSARDHLPTIVDVLVRGGARVRNISVLAPSLEDVFIELTSRRGR